jgi:hypothetical protein
VNLNVPGAVTVVSVDDFTRGTDWKRARKADRNMLASANPVLDPLLVTPLRHAVVNSAWGRGKIDVPPGIAKKLNETTVVTSTTPIAKHMRVNKGRGQEQREARRAEQPQQSRGQQKQIERRQQQAQGERVAAPARPARAPRAQPQPKHERPPQAQKQQQPKHERGNPGNPGKGKGKKP